VEGEKGRKHREVPAVERKNGQGKRHPENFQHKTEKKKGTRGKIRKASKWSEKGTQ